MKEYDVERHEKFKQYEMQKALEEELKMSKMNEFEKKQYEEELAKKKKAHKKQAQNLPHPVSFFLRFFQIVTIGRSTIISWAQDGRSWMCLKPINL